MAADLEQAVRELQGERDRVAALLQARRELIATVSHELRTPVATLRGYLETILLHWGEPSRATLHRDLEVMEHEVVQLQFLVEDLFTLARTEFVRLALRRGPIDIGKLVRRVTEAVVPLAWGRNKIEVVVEAPSEPLLVLVDANRLEQVLRAAFPREIENPGDPRGMLTKMCRCAWSVCLFDFTLHCRTMNGSV